MQNAARMEPMATYFRAVAVDYDGTIAVGPRPEAGILEAIAKVRSSGRYVVLVTGRIFAELLQDFPDVANHFDAVVAENGAVLVHAGRERPLAVSIPEALDAELHARGVTFRRGKVILATDSHHDATVRERCIALGLDAQLICNRSALMLLPAGVSKASGVLEALAELGVSAHSTIAIGDAENDLALLEACELGIAVDDAVPSLKQRADFVLHGHGPSAVQCFLEQDLPRGAPQIQPSRRRVALGIGQDGSTVTVPASRAQVFIDGPTGSGKSFVAGLLAERLVHAGYSICLLDMEGDHGNLGQLRGVLTLGGRDPLPSVAEVGRIVRHRFSSLVLDLSLREPVLRYAYARDVLEHLCEVRRDYGLPHWIFVEEAHMVPSAALDRARATGNLCLVTYHPDWLPPAALRDADALITVEATGRACLRTGPDRTRAVTFTPDTREVSHVRHRHKYAEGQVPYERGFTFRDPANTIGPHVASMAEFSTELERVPTAALVHHAKRHDFSRWVREVFHDRLLADAIARCENDVRTADASGFRSALRELVGLRYDLVSGDGVLP